MMTALLIDDEKKSIANLENILNMYFKNEFSRIESATSIDTAIKKITLTKPDIIFLDIQLKEGNGFDLLNLLPAFDFKLIFVTAYDQYSIKAIKLHAFDYLLKPIDISELSYCIQMLKQELVQPHSPYLPAKGKPQDYMVFKDNNKYEKIPFSAINYIEASGAYSIISYESGKSIVKSTQCKSLYELYELLDHSIFFRVHRSYIINKHYITKMIRKNEGYFIQLNDQIIPVSRRRLTLLTELINIIKC